MSEGPRNDLILSVQHPNTIPAFVSSVGVGFWYIYTGLLHTYIYIHQREERRKKKEKRQDEGWLASRQARNKDRARRIVVVKRGRKGGHVPTRITQVDPSVSLPPIFSFLFFFFYVSYRSTYIIVFILYVFFVCVPLHTFCNWKIHVQSHMKSSQLITNTRYE